MKKVFTSSALLFCFATVQGQVVTQSITAADLPNLIPGYSEISTINTKSITYNPTAPPSDPTPIDGDTTTERNDVYDYADPASMLVQMSDGNITNTSKGKVWTIQLNVINAKNIGIQFDQFNLSDSALMFIYNGDKTQLTGPIKKSIFNLSTNKIGIAPLNGYSVIIYIIERNNFSTIQSTIHISQILAGYRDWGVVSSSLSGSISPQGGIFDPIDCDASIQCYPNKLPYARAVARFGTNGYGGTGTMINNELNNGRPYFLTAFHVLDRNGNHQIDASEEAALSESFFIFRYWKTSCGGDISSSYITFYGAILHAAWRYSDVVLLELNNGPGIGDNVNYAGWNRTSTSPSDNYSFIIHHPLSKDMRITFTKNVHSFLFNGNFWQSFYSNGTVYKGSSGSALFNENGQIVGQLKGGWSSCVFTGFSDRYGKLSPSWNGGGTNSTRLSNWLSPTQNLSSTDLLVINPITITGATTIPVCNTDNYTYSVPNLYGCSYNWNVPSSLTIVSGQNTSTIVVTRNTSGPSGDGQISVTITDSKGINRVVVVTKDISVTAAPPVTLSSSRNPYCSGGYQTWSLSATPLSNGSNWQWYVDYTSPNSNIYIHSPNSSSTLVDVKGGGVVRLNYKDLCGASKQDGVTVYSTCQTFT
ncbi:MAG: trypsin-like peptidase domain-containing protein, partial [Chitinophagaceae bacterium]